VTMEPRDARRRYCSCLKKISTALVTAVVSRIWQGARLVQGCCERAFSRLEMRDEEMLQNRLVSAWTSLKTACMIGYVRAMSRGPSLAQCRVRSALSEGRTTGLSQGSRREHCLHRESRKRRGGTLLGTDRRDYTSDRRREMYQSEA
jgi:hypothetical protein